MKTSLNYVASLAAAMHDSRPEVTILAAGKQPKVLAEVDTRSGIQITFRRWIAVSEDYGGLPDKSIRRSLAWHLPPGEFTAVPTKETCGKP